MSWTDVKNKILSLNPSFYSTLGRKDGNIDLSENSYSMLAQGGMVIGNSIKDPIRLRGYGSTEFDGIDDRVVSSYGTRRNLVPNPSFEANTTGWSGNASSSAASIARVTTDSRVGDACLEVEADATAATSGCVASPVDVDPLATYSLSVWVKAPEGKNLSIEIRERDAGDSQIGTSSQDLVGTGEWERVQVSRTFGATGEKLRVYILAKNGEGEVTFYIDGVLVERAEEMLPYFDGDGYVEDDVWHPNVYSLSWEGTPNNSISTKEDSTGKRQNLWPNPKAEDLDGVNIYSGATVTSVVFKDEGIPNLLLGGKEFTKGYKVETTTSNQGVSANITTVPGEDYAHSAYVYVISGEVDVSIAGHGNGGNAHPQSSWQRVTHVTSTSKPDSTTETFTVRSANDNTVFYVTAILSEKANTIGNYFDGDGYIDNQENWKTSPNEKTGWLGTPRESPSDKGVFANGTTRTFMGWARRASNESFDALFSGDKDDSPSWIIIGTIGNPDRDLRFRPNGGNDTGKAEWNNAWPDDTDWHHWALVIEGDKLTPYIDGQALSQQSISAPIGPGVFQVGARWTNFQLFHGGQAHVAVFERALTPEEIAEIYDLAINPPPIPFSERDAEIVLLNPEEYGIVVLNEEITGFETNTDVNN